MKSLKDSIEPEFISISRENFRNLNQGQKVYITGHNNRLDAPVLIIGEFSSSSGDYLVLNNYSLRHIKLDIESSKKK